MSSRVLVLTSTFPRWSKDATTNFVYDLSSKFSEQGNQVTVLAPHASGSKKNEQYDDISVRRIQYAWPARLQRVFYDGGAANKKKSFSFYAQSIVYVVMLFFACFRQAGKHDIIHAHWLVPQGWVAVIVGFLRRKKVIVTVHGGDVYTMNGRIGVFLKRFVLKRADTVFVISEGTTNACKALYDREYVFGPMGVDASKFSYQGVSKKTKKILFVGRVSEEKGLKYLIDAMLDLKDFTLDIVGDGPQKKDLEKQIRQLDLQKVVTFHGWIPNEQVSTFMKNAEMFVSPSITLDNGWREGMGITYLEALFSGLPVVTTENAGAVDFVKEGVNGLIVKERNSSAIVSAVRKLHERPPKTVKFNEQLAVIKQTYSWDTCATRYTSRFKAN